MIFIIGKFYKIICEDSYVIFKLKSLKNDNLYIDKWFITSGGDSSTNYHTDRLIWFFTKNQKYIYEEVFIEDFVGQLPKGHPERIAFRNNRIKKILKI